MKKILPLVALACGLAIAYVDTRPHWDDAGITALALLACSGLLSMLAPKRPWQWALLVGIWIPIYSIITTHSFAMLVVLIFPLIGAYAGRLVRLFASKALSQA